MTDLISRQAAITIPVTPKEDREYQTFNLDDAYEQAWDDLQKRIEQLPSAQRTGRWIDKMLDHFRKYEVVCSECGARFIGNYDSYDEPYEFNFCPNCGARMEETNED